MAYILGRPLQRNEIVHHKDGNRLNNSPNNLELRTISTHHPGQSLADLKITAIADRVLRQLLPPEYHEFWTIPFCGDDYESADSCEVTAYMVVRDDEKRMHLRRPRRFTIFRSGKIIEHDDRSDWVALKQVLLDRGDINGALQIEDLMERGDRTL